MTPDQIKDTHNERVTMQRALEDRYGGPLLPVKEMPESHKQLREWIEEFRFGYDDQFFIVILDARTVRVVTHTRDAMLLLDVDAPTPNDKDSEGAIRGIMSRRTPEAGTLWTRSVQFPELPYNKIAWLTLWRDVAGFSLAPLSTEVLRVRGGTELKSVEKG